MDDDDDTSKFISDVMILPMERVTTSNRHLTSYRIKDAELLKNVLARLFGGVELALLPLCRPSFPLNNLASTLVISKHRKTTLTEAKMFRADCPGRYPYLSLGFLICRRDCPFLVIDGADYGSVVFACLPWPGNGRQRPSACTGIRTRRPLRFVCVCSIRLSFSLSVTQT